MLLRAYAVVARYTFLRSLAEKCSLKERVARAHVDLQVIAVNSAVFQLRRVEPLRTKRKRMPVTQRQSMLNNIRPDG